MYKPSEYFQHWKDVFQWKTGTTFTRIPSPGPNKLECYILLGFFKEKNTVAYWAHSWVAKKIKCCEYGPRSGGVNAIKPC